MDFEVNKLLIQACKTNNIKKFILTSSMYVNRPGHIVAFCINSMYADVLDWKLKSEVELRCSGLNYTIIRPGKFLKSEKN